MGDEPARCVLRIYIQLVLKKLILLFRRVFHYVVLHHHKESARSPQGQNLQTMQRS